MNLSLSFAWRNLWRHPRRTWLTMLGIGFGAALLVFSIGIQLGQYDMMIANSVRVYHGLLQVQKKGYLAEPRMRNSIAAIRQLGGQLRRQTGIEAIAARANGFALVSSASRTHGLMIVGVEPAQEKKVSSIPGLVREGAYLSGDSADEVVIGRSLARNMQVGVGDELTLMGTGRDGSIAAIVLPVAGIFESGSKDLDRSMLYIGIGVFQDLFSMGDHGHSLVVYHQDVAAVQALQQTIAALLPEEDLVVLRWDQLQPGLREMIELDYSSGWMMYVVLVAIITFSIMNTFLMTVLERTKEFGLLLALGSRPWHIGMLVMFEAFIMTVIALVLGTLVGVAVNTYFYFNGLYFPGMEEIASQFNMPAYITPQISLGSILPGPLVILVATLMAALLPTLRLRKLEPVVAMKAV